MRSTRVFYAFLAVTCSFLLMASCTPKTIGGFFNSSFRSPQPMAEVLFRAKILKPAPEGKTLMLEVLDDVTGLYFNSTRYELLKEDTLTYSVRVPLPVSADIKYRYVLASEGSSYEFNSQNHQVRFRIARINGPEIIDDIVSGWVDQYYSGPIGRISGQIIDAATNAPIPNLLIAAGGVQTISSSDGLFIMQGLVPGVHNLVIYSMDGAYETFQQGAVVAANANTPVQVALIARNTTKVTFEVTLPSGIDKSLPLRFVSNLLPLGNSYADLAAGSAGSAVNYPIMEKVGINRYSLTLDLPVGLYLRYKYSLGDGFWNAELDSQSKTKVRDLLIAEDLQIKDRVATFTARGTKPVHILVQAPADTPAQESVFIQLNPFGWMEPLPMVSAGINLWKYTIYSPLQYFDRVGYRYCRNGLCEVTPERADASRVLTPDIYGNTLSDVIFAWENLDKYTIDTTQFLSLESVQPKPGFIAGVELTNEIPSTWRYSIDDGLKYAAGIGGDWVILAPTWTIAETNGMPVISPSPDRDLLWPQLMNFNSHVMMNGQKTILYPTINYAQFQDLPGFSNTSEEWTSSFNAQYERFIYNYADLAQILAIEGLIIGAPLANSDDGSASADPPTDNLPWEELIAGVRQRYSGRLIAAVQLGSDESRIPDWLDQVDILYIVFSPTIQNNETSVAEFRQNYDGVLVDRVLPLFERYGKPVIIGFEYDSIGKDGTVDLPGQAKAYSAAILSVASQDWISGFISRGYYPYVELQDTTATIYRKPASEILWFWFHYLLNKSPD